MSATLEELENARQRTSFYRESLPAAPLHAPILEPLDCGRVAGAIAAVLEKHPGLESLSGGMKYARNTEYATPESPLEEGDILSFLPPVGGG